ncbi:WhiB family transcriptional regulator [Nocardioides aquiterrae]
MPTSTRHAVAAPFAAHDDWRLDARCATEPPDDFFPIGEGPAAQQQARRAKGVCQECPVREQCLEWALAADVRHGVFGGLDEGERMALRMPRPRGGG